MCHIWGILQLLKMVSQLPIFEKVTLTVSISQSVIFCFSSVFAITKLFSDWLNFVTYSCAI